MKEFENRSITVSIVSHGQGKLVTNLLQDLAVCSSVVEVVLTYNIPELDISCPDSMKARLRVIRNERPLGFSANHNQAFKFCKTPYFAVINPDIRFSADLFSDLILALDKTDGGVIAPTVVNPAGELEDSARYFPTLIRLMRKALGLGDGRINLKNLEVREIDWVAGMFLFFPQAIFREIRGFDEHFFLYYEDVDICARIWLSGRRVMLHPGVSVIHDPRRTSRRNLRYMRWHLSSMLRYFAKYAWRLPR
jgi:GT2 family glycosyltransferase